MLRMNTDFKRSKEATKFMRGNCCSKVPRHFSRKFVTFTCVAVFFYLLHFLSALLNSILCGDQRLPACLKRHVMFFRWCSCPVSTPQLQKFVERKLNPQEYREITIIELKTPRHIVVKLTFDRKKVKTVNWILSKIFPVCSRQFSCQKSPARLVFYKIFRIFRFNFSLSRASWIMNRGTENTEQRRRQSGHRQPKVTMPV